MNMNATALTGFEIDPANHYWGKAAIVATMIADTALIDAVNANAAIDAADDSQIDAAIAYGIVTADTACDALVTAADAAKSAGSIRVATALESAKTNPEYAAAVLRGGIRGGGIRRAARGAAAYTATVLETANVSAKTAAAALAAEDFARVANYAVSYFRSSAEGRAREHFERLRGKYADPYGYGDEWEEEQEYRAGEAAFETLRTGTNPAIRSARAVVHGTGPAASAAAHAALAVANAHPVNAASLIIAADTAADAAKAAVSQYASDAARLRNMILTPLSGATLAGWLPYAVY